MWRTACDEEDEEKKRKKGKLGKRETLYDKRDENNGSNKTFKDNIWQDESPKSTETNK